MAAAELVDRIKRLRQKQHRSELKIARLKNRQNLHRQADTRLKLRLGSLVYLAGWQNEDLAEIEKRIAALPDRLESENQRQNSKIVGENFWTTESGKRKSSEPELAEKDHLARTHHQITVGGLFVKYALQDFPKTALLGAMIQLDDVLGKRLNTGKSD